MSQLKMFNQKRAEQIADYLKPFFHHIPGARVVASRLYVQDPNGWTVDIKGYPEHDFRIACEEDYRRYMELEGVEDPQEVQDAKDAAYERMRGTMEDPYPSNNY